MNTPVSQFYTAFDGHKLIAQGTMENMALEVWQYLKSKTASASILIFSDLTGNQMDFDLRGSKKEVLERLQIYLPVRSEPAISVGPGRPKLGVIPREISLLPRHWEWLSTQSGGASATLRRLVDEAKRNSKGKERVKEAQERTQKFMSSLAGDLPHYEEALRELYRKDKSKFRTQIADWPSDIREYTKKLSAAVFE